jgi:hypothetical protein
LRPGTCRPPYGIEGYPFRHRQRIINRPLDLWCQRHGGAFSRGRPAHKTTIAPSSKKITPPFARSPAVSAIRVRQGLPPSKPSMTPTPPVQPVLPLHKANQVRTGRGKEKKNLCPGENTLSTAFWVTL